MNLVSISTGKFFKVQFVVFGKFTGAYYTKLQEKSYYYLLIMCIKKNHKKSRQTILWQRALAICNSHSCYKLVGTRVMDLYSCYLRMHSFSANQKLVIFFFLDIIKEQMSIPRIAILSWLNLLLFRLKRKRDEHHVVLQTILWVCCVPVSRLRWVMVL